MTDINKKLVEAVNQQNIALVESLLNEGADVNGDDRVVFKFSNFQQALRYDSKDLAYVILKHKPRITEVEKQFVEKLCENEWADKAEEVKSLLEDCELIPQYSGPITKLGDLQDDITAEQAASNLCEALKSVEIDNNKFNVASYLSKKEVEELAKIDLYNTDGSIKHIDPNGKFEEFFEKDAKLIDGVLSRVKEDLSECMKQNGIKAYGGIEKQPLGSIQLNYPNNYGPLPDVRWHCDSDGGYGTRVTLSLNDLGTLVIKENIQPTNFLTGDPEIFQADYGGALVFRNGDTIHSAPIISAPRMLAVFDFSPNMDYQKCLRIFWEKDQEAHHEMTAIKGFYQNYGFFNSLNKLWKDNPDACSELSYDMFEESDGLIGQELEAEVI
ncbi:MAG: hypothetical protein N4A31_04955 [Rickettsiales bacterium]|jgi:hypothetical protein|nr:hypothetical protein [Rickettsiales bacterium]